MMGTQKGTDWEQRKNEKQINPTRLHFAGSSQELRASKKLAF
jgi:hypothetical protein